MAVGVDARLTDLVGLVSHNAREEAYWRTSFLPPKKALERLETERPAAFVGSLCVKSLADPQAAQHSETLLTVVERAHELAIPVALISPNSQAIAEHITLASGDLPVVDHWEQSLAEIAAPVTGWLARIDNQAPMAA